MESRTAVLIANDRVPGLPPLPSLQAAVGTLARQLEGQGVKVSQHYNDGRRRIERALHVTLGSLRYDDDILIIYCGHTLYAEGTVYLAAADTDSTKSLFGIDINFINSEIRNSHCSSAILVLDSDIINLHKNKRSSFERALESGLSSKLTIISANYGRAGRTFFERPGDITRAIRRTYDDDHSVGFLELLEVIPRTVQGAAILLGRPAGAKGASTRRRPMGDSPPPSADECFFHAEMPGQPQLGRPARVEVTVAREKIERLPSPTSQTSHASVDRAKEIILQVVPRANCRTIGDDRATIPVPQIDMPMRLVFEVEGLSDGAAEVWVEARQGPVTLALLRLQPVFVPAQAGMVSATASALVGSQIIETAHLVLRIYEESLGPSRFRLRFNLDCKKPNINIDIKTREFELSRESFVADQYAKLEEAWISDGSEYDGFMRRLKARGIDIYDRLVPDEVRKTLWSHRKQIKAVQVISEEPFIPWEIAYLSDPTSGETDGADFLASFGLVRWLHNIPWPHAELKLRADRVRFVIPDYPKPNWRLPGATKEAEMLRRLFPGAKSVSAQSAEIEDLLREGGNSFDVLHFACHGLAEGDKIWDAGLMMAGRMVGAKYVPDPLEVAQVYAAAKLGGGGTRPIVFLNACQIGRTGRSLSGVGGFASAFLDPKSRQGASLFVGTLWSVGDGSALTFAETFYNRLKAGDTLVSATRAAREQGKIMREPTWLAYTTYGHPYAKIT
jgi:hypothetical protein